MRMTKPSFTQFGLDVYHLLMAIKLESVCFKRKQKENRLRFSCPGCAYIHIVHSTHSLFCSFFCFWLSRISRERRSSMLHCLTIGIFAHILSISNLGISGNGHSDEIGNYCCCIFLCVCVCVCVCFTLKVSSLWTVFGNIF